MKKYASDINQTRKKMKIKEHIIYFKSYEPFFSKERKGIKNNTVRTLEEHERQELIGSMDDLEYIGIISVETGLTFIRSIQDISFFEDLTIFTWETI